MGEKNYINLTVAWHDLKGSHQIHWACFQTNAIGWAKPKQEMILLILSRCHRQADVTLYKFKAFRGWGMPLPSSQTPVTILNWKPSYRATLSSGKLAPNIFQKQEQIQFLWLAVSDLCSLGSLEKTPKSTFTWSHGWRPYTYTLHAHTKVRHPEKQLSTLIVKTQIWNVFISSWFADKF